MGAIVHRSDRRELSVEIVLRVLGDAGVNRLISWEPNDLPIPEVTKAAVGNGVQLVSPPTPAKAKTISREWAAMATADAGLTGAVGGLADTGTVVLCSGPGRPRLTWLLPPLHVVVLHSSLVHPTLSAFMGECGELVRCSSHVGQPTSSKLLLLECTDRRKCTFCSSTTTATQSKSPRLLKRLPVQVRLETV